LVYRFGRFETKLCRELLSAIRSKLSRVTRPRGQLAEGVGELESARWSADVHDCDNVCPTISCYRRRRGEAGARRSRTTCQSLVVAGWILPGYSRTRTRRPRGEELGNDKVTVKPHGCPSLLYTALGDVLRRPSLAVSVNGLVEGIVLRAGTIFRVLFFSWRRRFEETGVQVLSWWWLYCYC
jgi:hypothetical protein